LLFLDLDRFKPVNDHFGHQIGDRLLRDVASRIACCAHSGDVIARLGGDEFAILMRDADEQRAIERAECIARTFDEPFALGFGNVSLTLSIGVRAFSQGECDAETLLREVDTAMYRVKRIGGNGYVAFSGAVKTEGNDARRTRKELGGVVERDELRLCFQPLVDVSARRIYGYEALVRWQHPARGLLAPAAFVPLAEDTGAISAIGAWVLERACRAAPILSRLHGEPVSVSVNVSSRELLAPGFYENLVRSLERTDMQPSLLQIESTESVFLADAAIVGALFDRIRALGVKVALDDFGTGYSSLGYLERFQFDALKVDRSFVAHVCDLSAKSEIVRMIVSLAHALGVEVIAEGIESREQLDALLKIGCTKVQGFLYGLPVLETELVDLIRTGFAGNTELHNVFAGRPLGVPQATLSQLERATLIEQVRSALDCHEARLAEFTAAIRRGDSSLDPDVVTDRHSCPIGVWLAETIDKRLRTSPLYIITDERHAVFHRTAARLIALSRTDDSAVHASLSSGGDFVAIAALMRRALEDWLALADAPDDPSAEARAAGGSSRGRGSRSARSDGR
jgi:diguanylate cyclase (GGDEF)-like protein